MIRIRSAFSILIFRVSLLAQPQEISPEMKQALEEFQIQAAGLERAGKSSSTGSAPPRTKAAWHGRIFENLRNDFLDAIPHEIVQRGGEQRKLRRNQFGVSITGPVLIPKLYNGSGKTFFTFSFEGMRESIGQSQLTTIPTLLERTGDWSRVVDRAGRPLPIFDPATTAANPAFDASRPVSRDNLQYTRVPFPGNRIPADRLDPVAQTAMNYYPAPNANAGPFFRNNYFIVSPAVNQADGIIATADHSFLARHRLTLDIRHSNGINGNSPLFLTIADPNSPPTQVQTRRLGLDHVFTASSSNINTLRFSASADRSLRQGVLDANGKPFPGYDLGDYANMGRNDTIRKDVLNAFALEETFATRWRTHRISLGAFVSKTQVNTFRPRYSEGSFDFRAGLTSLPGVNNTGHSFASFLLGESSFAERNVVISPSYFRYSKYQFTLNDQWQVLPSLTLTLGANLRTNTPRTEKYDRQSNISFAEIDPENGKPGALVAAGRNGFGRAFQPVWTKLEPSIGLAWSVLGNNNTVLRLNYARRYGEFAASFGHFATQAFNGIQNWNSPNPQLTPATVLRDGLRGGQSFPDLRPNAANGIQVDLIDASRRQPTTQEFVVSIQRRLAGATILRAEFRNQHGRNQFVDDDIANPNAVPLSALVYRDRLNDLAFNRSLRPYPQYLDFNVDGYPDGRFKTNSVEFRLEKRTSGGLALATSYKYLKLMDDYSSDAQDVYNRRNEWAISSNANPHELSLTYIYELPLGPGKSLLNHGGWRRHFVGGWAVSGATTFRTGPPLQLQAQFNNTGGVAPQMRVNVVNGVDPRVSNPGPGLWFNPAAFTHPADFTIGNISRTHSVLRNPIRQNHDLTLSKRFPVTPDHTLEFVLSMFNFVNHANWNNPDTEIGQASSPNVNAGRIIGSTGGRIVQLGLRLSF